jgi:hypothetical protein
MTIGQIEQMKIVQSQWRDRTQQADERIQHLVQEVEAPDHEAQRNPDRRRQAKAQRHALERGQDVPAYALVVRPVAVERIGKQLDGGFPHRHGSWQLFVTAVRDHLPEQEKHHKPQHRRQPARQRATTLGTRQRGALLLGQGAGRRGRWRASVCGAGSAVRPWRGGRLGGGQAHRRGIHGLLLQVHRSIRPL